MGAISDWINKVKRSKDKFLKPVANFFLKIGLYPSHISLFGLVSGFIAAYFMLDNNYLFLLFYLGFVFFDILDGPMARISKRFNWQMDFVVDRVVYFSFMFKAIFMDPNLLFIATTVLYFLFHVINYIRVKKHLVLYLEIAFIIAVFFNRADVGMWVILGSMVVNFIMLLLYFLLPKYRSAFAREF
ncbi:hypothetical protein ACFLZN_01785 [Nanoarchaeota archaeon]